MPLSEVLVADNVTEVSLQLVVLSETVGAVGILLTVTGKLTEVAGLAQKPGLALTVHFMISPFERVAELNVGLLVPAATLLRYHW